MAVPYDNCVGVPIIILCGYEPSLQALVSGLYDLLLHSMTRLLAPHCRAWLRLATALRWLVGDCFNAVVHHLVAAKLDTLLTSGRVAHLLTVIEVTPHP